MTSKIYTSVYNTSGKATPKFYRKNKKQATFVEKKPTKNPGFYR